MTNEEQTVIGAIKYIENCTPRYASVEEIKKHVYLTMEEVETLLSHLVDNNIVKLEGDFYTIISVQEGGQ